MRSDVPAAVPLIAFVSGLLFGHSYAEAAGFAIIGVLVALLRHPRCAIAALVLAAGIASAAHARAVADRERRFVARETVDRFVEVEAPIDREWMARGSVFMLRVARFRADGVEIRQPLAVLTRFAPAWIDLQDTVVAEGLLRANEQNDLTLTVKSPRLLRYAGRVPWWAPSTWNRVLDHRLRPFLRQYPTEVALVEALALGRGERLADAVRDSYKRAGTYHLLVFSGLQIALAAAAVAALLRFVGAPRASDWSLLLFAAFAPLFIGANASVSRAAIAIGLFAVSRLLHRPTRLENLWCLAALIRLALAPEDVADAAFQLTYAGAGALLFVAKPFATRRARWIAYAAGVECVITPLTLFHFHQYALGGSLTTIALTPVITLMLFLSVLTCAAPCGLLLGCIGALHTLSLRMNEVAAVATGAFAAPPRIAFAAALLASLFAVAMLRGRRRAAAIAACALFATGAAVRIGLRNVDEPHITVFDVGQGDAILVRTRDRVVLVDGGPSPARILPLLADAGVHRIDAVVLTHAHPDHCGGLPAVLARFSVRELWLTPRRFVGDCAQALMAAASIEQVPVHLVRDGDRLSLGDLTLRAIVGDRTLRRSAENNSSIVLSATIGKRSALLTGDIEREAETMVAGRTGRVDVLKIAHHGSRSSSTPALLDAAAPKIAVISCGRHNLFGHPHAEVVDALRMRRVTISRTDRDGTVDIAFRGDHIFVHHQIDTPR